MNRPPAIWRIIPCVYKIYTLGRFQFHGLLRNSRDLWWSRVEINIHSLWWIGHPQFSVRRPRGGRSVVLLSSFHQQFDDSSTSTRCLYLSPSQLCLIKRIGADQCTLCNCSHKLRDKTQANFGNKFFSQFSPEKVQAYCNGAAAANGAIGAQELC